VTELAGVGAAADVLAGDPHRTVEAANACHQCANCGTPLQGAYCHACGQKGHLHTRLWHLAEDFVEGVMHFDGRLWRTLPMLSFRPGRLSRAWIEGKRVRYVAPLHVFLFGIFLFFLALSLTGGKIYADVFSSIGEGGADATVNGRRCVDLAREGALSTVCEAIQHISKDPDFYAYKAESTTYKLAPLLAPLVMLILAVLLAFKRGYTLYDHGVVALYGLSFVALSMTLAILLNQLWPGDWVLVVFAAAVAHALLHLRGAYRLSWLGAALRTGLLGLATSMVVAVFLIGVATVSAA